MTTQPIRRPVPTWTLADRLRKIRTAQGMHQRDFADALEVKASRYAAWESGRNTPEDVVAVAKRIQMLTGVPASWTLGLGLPRQDSDLEPSDNRFWKVAA